MRLPATILATLTALSAALVVTPAALAHEVPSRVLEPAVPDAAYFATDNITHVARFPEHAGASGGELLGDYFYLTDPRGVYVYDVTDPLAPELVGSTVLFMDDTMAALGQEDPDTNGQILLVDAIDPDNPTPFSQLQVVDVSDVTNPHIVGTLATSDHTWTCVAECTFAYGRTGGIVDLTDPANPTEAGNWMESIELAPGYTHDFTEVGPNRLVSSGQPSVYLDTTDPANPVLLNEIRTRYHSLGYHGTEWANDGQDRFMLMGTEIAPAGATENAGSDCQGEGSWIATYDTTDILAAEAATGGGSELDAEFELVDTWQVPGRGAYVDGNAPAHTLYCAHWFDLHPQWSNGGLVAAGYYDWGTRILRVHEDGTFDDTEAGWFQPVAGYTSAAYWISDDVIYSIDYRRGMDILQFEDTEAAGAVRGTDGSDVTTPVATSDVPTASVAEVDAESVLPVTGGSAATLAVGLLGLAFGLLRRRGAMA